MKRIPLVLSCLVMTLAIAPAMAQVGLPNDVGKCVSNDAVCNDDSDCPNADTCDLFGISEMPLPLRSPSAPVIIAVLDSGFDCDHPGLPAGICWSDPGETCGNGVDDDLDSYIDEGCDGNGGWDFLDDDNDPDEGDACNGHSQVAAGILAAESNDFSEIAGLMRNGDVKLMNLRTTNCGNTGTLAGLAEAIDFAQANGADLITGSLLVSAGWSEDTCFDNFNDDAEYGDDSPCQTLCNSIASFDGLYVGAAGNLINDSSSSLNVTPRFPPECNHDRSGEKPADNMIIVGGYRNDGATFSDDVNLSNWGNEVVNIASRSEDVCGLFRSAPGGNLFDPNGWSCGADGTSWATPYVTATAAHLLLEARANATPLTTAQLRTATLALSSAGGWSTACGGGACVEGDRRLTTFLSADPDFAGLQPVCGDNTLDFGETCDDGNLTPGDGCDAMCAIEPLAPRAFSDDFDRGALGPGWSVDSGIYTIVNDVLVQTVTQTFTNSVLRWVDDTAVDVDQYGKIRMNDVNDKGWGFAFRMNGSPGLHYQVHSVVNSPEWRWETYNPGYVVRNGSCTGDTGAGDGDWIGATIEGTGASTVVSVWRWDDDPDAGGPVDIDGNWGAPDCTMAVAPAIAVDTGNHVGLRTYTSNSTIGSSVDNWFSGDVPPLAICGNGIVEAPEACDDGMQTDMCDADCTLPTCGDGTLNTLAGEACEVDGDCLAGEICDGGCACIPAPVCGNGLIEAPETCDDTNATPGDGCDENCILEVCGNGVLQTGEECDDGNLMPGDGCDAMCVMEPEMRRDFMDDFNRATLGPDWSADSGSYTIVSNALAENGTQTFNNAVVRWDADSTLTVNQYGKLQLTAPESKGWGFAFRLNATPGLHYQVHLVGGSDEWRWETYNPDFVIRNSDCSGDQAAGDGEWIGATIEGAGVLTVINVWRWDSDPDAGGSVNVSGNWGAPDCSMSGAPLSAVDTGTSIGLRTYTRSSTALSRVDSWSGGDLAPASVCGDGVVEGVEACDDFGTQTGTCEADCTLPTCGDNILNTLAGEACEVDGDCLASEVCDGGCACIPAPVCGNGLVDAGEECDDTNTVPGDGCDENCILEVCGNGVVQMGEECDDGNMTPGDGCDASCVIEPFSPKDFSDSFDRATLGSNWMADFGSFAIIGNELVDTAMSFFTNSVLRWGNGTTTDIDQYGKLQLVNPVGKGWGFSFRLNGTPGLHYQVHLVLAENEWRWETYDPGYVSRSDSCLGDETASNGDWMGATVEGSGASTLVRVWRWNLDPDMGGPVDISNNWGAPDCIMAANPTDAVDGGNSLGLRTYNRNSTADSFVDNWAGGDCAGACGATIAGDPRVLEIFNGTGAGISGSFIDPDGLAFDSAGNVFAAACGLGPDSEGVFMRTPEGVITEVISDLGDNMGNPLSCPVGMLMSPSDTLSTVGFLSDNAFSRTSAGVINEIIDSTGDGMGNVLDGTLGIAIDSNGSIYVTGHYSDNVFRVETGGTVTEIIDSTGDGLGNVLDAPFGVAVDSADNVYVTGFGSDNIFQIAPGGVITEILDSTGGGVASLLAPHALAVGPDDSLYIAGNSSDNVLRRFPNGTVRVILDSSGAGPGQPLDNPTGIDVASNGKVYVAAFNSENVFEITPGGGVTELIDSNGDGITQFNEASDFCVLVNSATSTLYVANTGPETVYRVLLTCGDGVVEPGLETCDDAGASATCDDDCTLPLCGDGNVNAAFGEQCEVDVDCGGGMTCSGCTCS